jgi:exonuclease SbcC
MKTIQIKKMSLTNFKGLRNQEIIFDENTNIYGANGTGKTTIFDAFTWMLFGKDSTDRKDFEIKTLDKFNVAIPKIEHEVAAIILVDGVEISISRILSEMWPKKKGSETTEFAGNKTEFYWDGVPMQQKAFQEKVSAIMDETVFKLITNPQAFNAMKWQDRRNVLIDIAGHISDEDLARGNSEYENLIAQLTNDKTLVDYQKQILASIKKAKEDLKAIPTRIDEVSKSRPEAVDFNNLKVSLGLRETDLKKVDEAIQNKSAAFDGKLAEINKKKAAANALKSDIEIIETNTLTEIENGLKPNTAVLDNLKRNLETKKGELASYENGLNSLKAKATSIEGDIQAKAKNLENLRNEWAVENAKTLTFNDEYFHCPTCKREFEAGDVEGKKAEMLANFKTKKAEALAAINVRGSNLGIEKTNLETELETIKGRIANGTATIETLKSEVATLENTVNAESEKLIPGTAVDKTELLKCTLEANSVYVTKKMELEALIATIEEVPTVDISDLQSQRAVLVEQIDSIKSQLRNEDQIKAVDNRIAELEKEEKELAQQIANVEKTQFVIERFNKLKIDTLEAKINEKFQFVKFRMFETQINGGEAECCDALVNGVPFSDANTASKINAGLDIINTLCEFYQVTAPIFIDNRESIIKVIDIQSQLINLIVSEKDEKLRVA